MKRKRTRKVGTTEVRYNCLFCSTPCTKLLYTSSVKSGHSAKFCNRACMVKYMQSKAFHFPCFVCGKPIYTQPAQLKLRARSTCSLECRRILIRKRAEANRRGYTKHQLDRLARYSPEAETWRKAVFQRDDYTCQFCKVRGTYLEADHIKPWAYFPELRFDIDNGRTLCRTCHDKTKISAKAMRELYAKD